MEINDGLPHAYAAIAEAIGVPRDEALAPIVIEMYREALSVRKNYDLLLGDAAVFFKGTDQDRRQISGDIFVDFVTSLCRGMQYIYHKHGVAMANWRYAAHMEGDRHIAHFWNPGGRDHDHIIISRSLILKYQEDKLAKKTKVAMIDTEKDFTPDEAMVLAGVHEASHSRGHKNPSLLTSFVNCSINSLEISNPVAMEYKDPIELLAKSDVGGAIKDLKLGSRYREIK